MFVFFFLFFRRLRRVFDDDGESERGRGGECDEDGDQDQDEDELCLRKRGGKA